MLFGPAYDVYTGSYIHVGHRGGEQDMVAAYHSYYWLRYEYQFKRYDRDYGESPPAAGLGADLLSSANPYNGAMTGGYYGDDRTVTINPDGSYTKK
jgi:hypothetical protein